jgi:DNA-directed RNA polymerase specialized sigma24 family protein
MEENPEAVSDAELMALIGQKTQAPNSARAALRTLHSRHAKFIYRYLEEHRTIGRGFDSEDIVQRTFEEVYYKAAAKFEPGSYPNRKAELWHIRKWLLQVAHFMRLKMIESRSCELNLPRDPTIWNVTNPEATEDTTGILLIAAEVLSELDLEIVHFKLRYYDPRTKRADPPPDLVKHFCSQRNLTPNALNQRYKRAKKTIEEAYVSTARR